MCKAVETKLTTYLFVLKPSSLYYLVYGPSVVIFYIIFLRTSVSLIQIGLENLALQRKVRGYDISIGYSCTGKGPNSESLDPRTDFEGLTAALKTPVVLRQELLAPPFFQNPLSAAVDSTSRPQLNKGLIES